MELQERAKEMKDFFNEKIDTYDNVHEQFMETKKALSDTLSGNIEKVLDLGAGTGLELIEIYKKYPNVLVTAVDASDKMLEKLMERDFASNITPICGDFFEVDFGTDFDAVISTSSLHHFTEKDKLVLYKKILLCLKNDGMFVNCDKVCATEEEQNFGFREYETNKDAYKHLDTPLTPENEVKLLREAGFRDISCTLVDKDNYRLFSARR